MEIWRVNLNTTIINGIMIKSHHNIWNQKNGFWKRGPGFEVRFWRLAVTLYWWLSWFITTKGVEFVHLSSKTWWEEVRATDNLGISLVSNYFTEYANNLLSNVNIYNKCLYDFCIIVDGIWGTKMMRELTLSGKYSLGYNNLYITIESINIYPWVDSQFYVVVKECDEIYHIEHNE